MPNWKKLIVSGSDAILSSVTASNGFFGTASWARNASTASFISSLRATGSTGQIQVNNNGLLYADSGFVYYTASSVVAIFGQPTVPSPLQVTADGTDGVFIGGLINSITDCGIYSANGDQTIASFDVATNLFRYSYNKYIYSDGTTSHLFTGSIKTEQASDGSTLYYNHVLASLANGLSVTANGSGSHAEGASTTANSGYSHAEGSATQANGFASHTEGVGSITTTDFAHAEGYYTVGNGQSSHAEGYYTTASGIGAHAEGSYTLASSRHSHAEGIRYIIDTNTAISMGSLTNVAFQFDSYPVISADSSGIEVAGDQTGAASWPYTVTYMNIDNGADIFDVNFVYYPVITITNATYDGGSNTTTFFLQDALTEYAYIQGGPELNAYGYGSHAEGYGTRAMGIAAHSEGILTSASGDYTHAEGYGSNALGQYSHAEGYYVTAGGDGSHAEGLQSTANGVASHTEGHQTLAVGYGSHAEGRLTLASGAYSHAEGSSSVAFGTGSHASGLHTIASGSFQTTIGQYNKRSNTTDLFVIGNGTSDASRSDILTVSTSSMILSASFTVFTGSAVEFQVTNTGVKIGNALTDTHQITGSLRITGSLIVSASGATIELYGSKIIAGTVGGDEGGEILLGQPQTNTTLAGGITIDSYQNRLRFFEQGGNARGGFIDITSLANSATTDLRLAQQLEAQQAMGSTIKANTIGCPTIWVATSGIGMNVQTTMYTAVYIHTTMTITGVKWIQQTQGNYTANNYNGVGLYSASGGTLTLVVSSSNDGNIWKGGSNSLQSKAFGSTYTANAGVYYIGALYSRSATVTDPAIGFAGSAAVALASWANLDFTNSNKVNGTAGSGLTALATSVAASGISNVQHRYAFYLY